MTGSTDELLAQVPLLQGLSGRQLREVASLVTTIDGEPGKVLTREGEQGQEFVLILDGQGDVRRGGEVIATRGPGDYVGEIALIEDVPRTATVVAKTPVRIGVIGRREFRALLDSDPEIDAQIRRVAAEREHDLDQGGSGAAAVT
jgi:CRP-like cAMP-binding protein